MDMLELTKLFFSKKNGAEKKNTGRSSLRRMRQRSRPIDRPTADDPSLSSAAAGVTESWAQCFAVLHRRVLTIDNKGHTKLMIDVFFFQKI